MGTLDPARNLAWLAALAVWVAFCSASQDIVFDAYKTDLLPAQERDTGAAVSVLNYRLAMLVSGSALAKAVGMAAAGTMMNLCCEIGALLLTVSILMGCVLDYRAMKRFWQQRHG